MYSSRPAGPAASLRSPLTPLEHFRFWGERAGRRRHPPHGQRWWLAAVAAALPWGAAWGQQPPSAISIQPAVLRHFTADQQALSQYRHLERIVLTKNGQRSDRTVRVYYIHGRAVAPEVAANGRPLGPKALAAQQKAAALRAAQLARRPPPPPGMLEFQGHDYAFKQLAEDFRYGPGRVVQWRGRTTWIYPAYPNPNGPHRSRAEQVLLGSEGTVWIDARDLHLVRVQMHTFRPVKYFGGLLANVHAASLDLQLERVEPGIWLPRRIAFRVQATILLLKQFDESKIETYWGYGRRAPPQRGEGADAGAEARCCCAFGARLKPGSTPAAGCWTGRRGEEARCPRAADGRAFRGEARPRNGGS